MLPTLMADLDKSDWINNHFLWLSKLVPFAVTNEAPESYPSHTLQEIDGHKKISCITSMEKVYGQV